MTSRPSGPAPGEDDGAREGVEGVAVGNIRTSESTRRDQRGAGGPRPRALRCLLGGSLVAGTLAAGGGALLTAAPVGAAATSSGTCTPALAPTPAQQGSTTGVTSKSVTVGNVSIISGPITGPVRGCAHRGEGVLRHDQRPGRCQRPQADRRLQGRRVQRPAEPDRDPGGDQQRLRPGGQLLALRRLRVRRPGQQHRGARRLGHARLRHRRAAQRLQRPAPVARGDPRAGRLLQEALPQGHDGRGHRLRRGVGQDSRLPGSWPP